MEKKKMADSVPESGAGVLHRPTLLDSVGGGATRRDHGCVAVSTVPVARLSSGAGMGNGVARKGTAIGKKSTSSTRTRYYGVRVGRRPGVYASWSEAQTSVGGFSGAVFRRFDDSQQAWAYVTTGASVVARAPATPLNPNIHAAGSAHATHTVVPANNSVLQAFVTVAPPLVAPSSDGTQHGAKTRNETNGDKKRAFRYAVYWAAGDPRNEAGHLPGKTQCERRAGLYAMSRAARALASDRWDGPVEICSDCSHAVMWARDYMPVWRRNGWSTARGAEPIDADVLRALSDALDTLSGGDVRFVHRLRMDRSPSMAAARRLATSVSSSS